jgi:hypothetical protein
LHCLNQAQGFFSDQLLLQLETYLLLNLAMLRLTESVPGSYPGAQAAREAASLLCHGPLHSLWMAARLHKLPEPAAYTGPQLALQLLPSPQPLVSSQSLQQLPQQRSALQNEEQPAGWYIVAPSAPLLTELLPLLIRQCLRQLQQHQSEQQQPRVVGHSSTCLDAVGAMLQSVTSLLVCSVLPAPGAAAEVARASSPAAAGECLTSQVIEGYVLHAQDVLKQHSQHIISILEATLRLSVAGTQALKEAAAMTSAGGVAASTGVAAASAVPLAADDHDAGMDYLSGLLFILCCPRPCGNYHCPSPLVLLALSAGPGSKVERQLHSLLASMVKVSRCSMLNATARLQCGSAAAFAASLLLDGAATLQQPVATAVRAGGATDCSKGYAAANARLPSVVIMGHCCRLWCEQLLSTNTFLSKEQQEQQQEPCSSQEQHQQQQRDVAQDAAHRGGTLSFVQQWLTAGTTGDHLATAGYATQAVLQQLEQLLATLQSLQDGPSDSAALLAAAQQLQATGLALYSFAVPCVCNNPGCTSIMGLSELASVSGRSCICAGCGVARYCGRACQRAAWKQHKPVCGALAAAASCAGTAAGAPL